MKRILLLAFLVLATVFLYYAIDRNEPIDNLPGDFYEIIAVQTQ